MNDSAARHGLRVPGAFVVFSASECDQSIHHAFEQHAQCRPHSPAIRLPSSDISYGDLNAAANRTARLLLETLDGDSGPVALMLDQGYDSIVWTLAILKAGLCYAPLDQRLPRSVLGDILTNLGARAVIASSDHAGLARILTANRFPVIAAAADRAHFSCENLAQPASPDNAAYVFYTSGSTGVPKGVVDCHRNVLHNIRRYTNSLKFAQGDVLSLVQNPSFSGTVSSLFGALLNGATVAPFDLQGEGLSALSPWLRRARVTVFHAVPSIFRQLADPIDHFPDIRLVRLEGDRASALDIAHFRNTFQHDCTLVNGLGATECGLVRQFFVGKNTTLAPGEPVRGDLHHPTARPVPPGRLLLRGHGGLRDGKSTGVPR